MLIRIIFVVFSYIMVSISSTSYSDTLHVMYVKGEVVRSDLGTLVRVGDEIQESDRLVFNDATSLVDVVSKQYGRMVISPNSDVETNILSEKSYLIKNIFFNSRKNLDSRSGLINNNLELKNYLKTNILMFDDMHIIPISSALKIDDNEFFYVQFEFEENFINKMLPITPGKIILDIKDIYSIEGVEIDKNKTKNLFLHFYSKKGDEVYVTDLGIISLIFIDDAIKKQVEILRDNYKVENQEQEKKAISEFLSSRYGKVCEICLRNWLH